MLQKLSNSAVKTQHDSFDKLFIVNMHIIAKA
jgi:hypothetical protein